MFVVVCFVVGTGNVILVEFERFGTGGGSRAVVRGDEVEMTRSEPEL